MPAGLVVLHFQRPGAPRRRALEDHLWCWRRYGRGQVLYLNAALGHAPEVLRRIAPSVVVLHTSFLAQRWNATYFESLVAAYAPLIEHRPFVVAVPQDEFLQTTMLERTFNHFAVRLVLTCADGDDARRIYPAFFARGGRLERVLTGYFEPATLRRLGGFSGRPHRERTIDVGYRAWKAEAWLGRHGWLKRTIAEHAAALAVPLGLRTDLSLEASAVLHGDDWYRFLAQCRATLGVEGGSSILDRDGSLRAKVHDYVSTHPEASFDAIEAACFPGADGTLALFCLSPRHLEACATNTAQLLVEGTYNGILEAERHYFPVRRDLRDLDRALRWLRDAPTEVASMAERARCEVLQKPELTYPWFVRQFETWLDAQGAEWSWSTWSSSHFLQLVESCRAATAASRYGLWRWKKKLLAAAHGGAESNT